MKELIEYGKKYFPKLSVRYTLVKHQKLNNGVPTERIFLNYPKNKGSYTVDGFRNHLIHTKLLVINKLLKSKGISSNMSLTNSMYFTYKDKTYRISNHASKFEFDFSYIIKYTSNEEYLFKMILNH